MSKDQAAMLRALVQHQSMAEPTVTQTNEPSEKLGTFTPLIELKKPSQILKPTLEIVMDPTIDESKGIAKVVQESNPTVEIEKTSNQRIESSEVATEEKVIESVEPDEEENLLVEQPLKSVTPLAQAEDGIRILAVCSGKGGVGKTNVVLNLAIALKQQGKNPLIIDTDFGFTNIDVLCGMMAPYSLQDVLSGEKQLKEIIVEGPEGVRIIPGGNDVVHLNDMSECHKKVFEEQFSQLEGVDVLLIDMGAGVSKTSLLYTMFAQEILLVVTPEPTSLTDAYSLLKTMELSHIEHEVRVVVNRAMNEDEANRTYHKLEATVSTFLERIRLKYLTYIHDDTIVSASVKAQVPFLIQHPDSLPSQDVLKLMETLFEITPPKKRFKNMQQVLGRLMRVFS